MLLSLVGMYKMKETRNLEEEVLNSFDAAPRGRKQAKKSKGGLRRLLTYVKIAGLGAIAAATFGMSEAKADKAFSNDMRLLNGRAQELESTTSHKRRFPHDKVVGLEAHEQERARKRWEDYSDAPRGVGKCTDISYDLARGEEARPLDKRVRLHGSYMVGNMPREVKVYKRQTPLDAIEQLVFGYNPAGFPPEECFSSDTEKWQKRIYDSMVLAVDELGLTDDYNKPNTSGDAYWLTLPHEVLAKGDEARMGYKFGPDAPTPTKRKAKKPKKPGKKAKPGKPAPIKKPKPYVSECDDGLDNDGDGETDWPDDPECTERDWISESESPADYRGEEPGEPVKYLAECEDDLDNDGDGDTDEEDKHCVSDKWNHEDRFPAGYESKKPGEKPAEKPGEGSAEKPADEPGEKPAEDPIETVKVCEDDELEKRLGYINDSAEDLMKQNKPSDEIRAEINEEYNELKEECPGNASEIEEDRSKFEDALAEYAVCEDIPKQLRETENAWLGRMQQRDDSDDIRNDATKRLVKLKKDCAGNDAAVDAKMEELSKAIAEYVVKEYEFIRKPSVFDVSGNLSDGMGLDKYGVQLHVGIGNSWRAKDPFHAELMAHFEDISAEGHGLEEGSTKTHDRKDAGFIVDVGGKKYKVMVTGMWLEPVTDSSYSLPRDSWSIEDEVIEGGTRDSTGWTDDSGSSTSKGKFKENYDLSVDGQVEVRKGMRVNVGVAWSEYVEDTDTESTVDTEYSESTESVDEGVEVTTSRADELTTSTSTSTHAEVKTIKAKGGAEYDIDSNWSAGLDVVVTHSYTEANGSTTVDQEGTIGDTDIIVKIPGQPDYEETAPGNPVESSETTDLEIEDESETRVVPMLSGCYKNDTLNACVGAAPVFGDSHGMPFEAYGTFFTADDNNTYGVTAVMSEDVATATGHLITTKDSDEHNRASGHYEGMAHLHALGMVNDAQRKKWEKDKERHLDETIPGTKADLTVRVDAEGDLAVGAGASYNHTFDGGYVGAGADFQAFDEGEVNARVFAGHKSGVGIRGELGWKAKNEHTDRSEKTATVTFVYQFD
jgi:hypothetical protein